MSNAAPLPNAYRCRAPQAWNEENALQLVAKAVEAERIGYDGTRLHIKDGMVVIPAKVSRVDQGDETRAKILAALADGPLAQGEIMRRTSLTRSQINYQLPRLQLMGSVRRLSGRWGLTEAGAQRKGEQA